MILAGTWLVPARGREEERGKEGMGGMSDERGEKG